MNFYQISLTTKCNLKCWHCPMAEYRNTDNDKFKLTNERLIPWILRNLNPRDWIIELTGGEPALYEGIDELVSKLTHYGYHGLIKTNGLLPINKSPNFIRVAAYHNLEKFPKYYDQILIVDKIDSDIKIKVCDTLKVKYKVIGKDKENFDNASHGFKLIGFMDNHGHPTPCPTMPPVWEDTPDHYAVEFQGLRSRPSCQECKAAIDAWRFIPDSWK